MDENPFSNEDKRFMKRALALAKRAQGQTAPNPAVGAVIVRDGKIIGEGYHKRAGAPHAEAEALANARESVEGADMYVTLEPCAHHGRTPPCAEAIVKARIRRVVIASLDPNRSVEGGSAGRLRAAGVRVETGLLRDQAIRLNEGFHHFHLTGRPLVTCKWAMTLDGQAAAISGDSKWITNAKSRGYVHRLRARHDAVLVGIGTVLSDNPSLNARLPRYKGRQPIRVVADGGLRTPSRAKCLTAQPGGPTWLITTDAYQEARRAELEAAGFRVIQARGRRRILDFADVIARLGAEGIQSVFVEGGPTIHAALLEGDLCDKAVVFIAPKTIGLPSRYKRNPIYGWGMSQMSDALTLHEVSFRRFDSDVCVQGDYQAWNERFPRDRV